MPSSKPAAAETQECTITNVSPAFWHTGAKKEIYNQAPSGDSFLPRDRFTACSQETFKP